MGLCHAIQIQTFLVLGPEVPIHYREEFRPGSLDVNLPKVQGELDLRFQFGSILGLIEFSTK